MNSLVNSLKPCKELKCKEESIAKTEYFADRNLWLEGHAMQ